MADEPMDVEAALGKLNAALALQYRSALQFTDVAGSVQGLEWQALGAQLWNFAAEELDDARRLVEKIVALGGTPTSAVGTFAHESDPASAVAALIENECEAVATLHEVIPETGQEPRSEAVEHLVEHLIMREQEQVDTLRRALGTTT